ncbi:MAG: YciI family protein [Candidatus Competibacteraceae bacterium]
MNYYVLESQFQKPFDQFGSAVSEHRAYLQTWYDKGVLLCSGPKMDKSGGVIIGKAESITDIETMIAGDPYNVAGLAKYTIKEFNPVKKAAVLDAWT